MARLLEVRIEFANGDPLKLDGDADVQDAEGGDVPLRDVLSRLGSGEPLYYRGTARVTRVAANDWEEAEEVEVPCRTLLHLGGVVYASELYAVGPRLAA